MSRRVLLIDIDSTIPNLALMKLSSWHKAQGDHVALRRMAKPDMVYASCVFTWGQVTLSNARNFHPDLLAGGPGTDIKSTLPALIAAMPPDYSLYRWDLLRGRGFTKPFALGYLTKGCPRRCRFCIVWDADPTPRQVATLDSLLRPDTNLLVLLDDNFLAKEALACSLLEEMTERRLEVCFGQGLDIRFLTDALAEKLAKLSFWNLHRTSRQLTFAFDSLSIESSWRTGIERVLKAGVKPRQIQSLFLVGFDSTPEEDLERFRIMRSYGVDPFCMVYRDRKQTQRKVSDTRLHHFAKWVNQRLYNSCTFEDYRPWARQRSQLPLPL